MTWVAVGVTAASVVSGAMGASASKKAAAAQTSAANAGMNEQTRQYDLARQDQVPFMETGTQANARLRTLLGLGDPNAEARTAAAEAAGLKKPTIEDARRIYMEAHQKRFGGATPDPTGMGPQTQQIFRDLMTNYDIQAAQLGPQGSSAPTDGTYGSLTRKFTDQDLQADPVYRSGLEFGLNEGRGAINARAIAGGGYDSGATLKALTRFGTDYGSTKAGESYNRFNTDNTNIYNRLAGVSGAGQVATGQVQAAGTNAANNTSELMTQAGNARAAGIVGGANAWGGALGGAANAAQNYQSNQQLMALLKRNQSSYPAYNASAGGV